MSSKIIEDLKKENASLKKKLAGKETYIKSLKEDKSKSPTATVASKTVQH
jgi:hypothetical protein